MFGAQRLQKIRELILEHEIVDVSSLSEKLNVSDVTIRRDLDKLEKEGFINKTYGGAILNKEYKLHTEPSLKSADLMDEDNDDDDINLITKIALKMIQGDEAIYLGGGQISRSIAKNLTGVKRLSVITNDIFVVSELNSNPDIKVTVTGGDLIPSAGIMVGPRVLATLSEIYLNKAFFDVKGIDFRFGYSMETYDEAIIMKEIMNISKEVVVLADENKFDFISYSKLGDLNSFKKVISNKGVPENYKKYYYDNFIKLYTSYDIN